MPLYRLVRHVIFSPQTQETLEVWGIAGDKIPEDLITTGAPPSTDADDPLRRGPCSLLLLMRDGDYVTWERLVEWLGEVNYELVSGYAKLSPYSTMIIKSKGCS